MNISFSSNRGLNCGPYDSRIMEITHDQFFDWWHLHSSKPFPNTSNVRPQGTWWKVTPENTKNSRSGGEILHQRNGGKHTKLLYFSIPVLVIKEQLTRYISE